MKKLWFILLSAGFVYVLAFNLVPIWLTWGYFLALTLYITLSKTKLQALEAFFLALPFYFVLPNPYSESLPIWRLLVLILFTRLFGRDFWFWLKSTWKNQSKSVEVLAKNFWQKLAPAEKLALFLFVWSAVTLIWAQYPLRGVSQLVFLLNAALVYPVVKKVVKDRSELVSLLRSLAWSAGTVVAIGYLQLLLTLVFKFYYFWQFWAMQVANLFYGRSFANVLTYSNSWFSLEGGTENLRMFSVMPSSHAFAMVAVFFLSFAVPLLALRKKRPNLLPFNKEVFIKNRDIKKTLGQFWTGRMPIWYSLRFSGLAVILSGTRGVWVGLLAPFLLSVLLWWKGLFKELAKIWTLVLSLVVFFFVLSPFINMGLHYIRVAGYRENFLERASSIYDLEEQSNVGRLQIWQESARFALDHPFGVGYGNFISSLTSENQNFKSVGAELNKRYNLPQRYVTAHSLYLQLIVELSVVGLVLFVLFWLAFYKEVWKYLKQANNEAGFEALVVFGFSMVFLWFLAYSTFDLTWLNDKILLYTFASLGVVRTLIFTIRNTNGYEYEKELKG